MTRLALQVQPKAKALDVPITLWRVRLELHPAALHTAHSVRYKPRQLVRSLSELAMSGAQCDVRRGVRVCAVPADAEMTAQRPERLVSPGPALSCLCY